MSNKHSVLLNDIKLYLESLPFSKPIVVTPGTIGSMKSVSDLLVCMKGLFIAIEVKTGDDTPKKGQDRFLNDVRKARGLTCVAYSLQDVKYFLEYHDLI